MLVAVVAVHVVMILRHMIRIRILEIRKGRRVSRPEGLASRLLCRVICCRAPKKSPKRVVRGIDVPKGVVRRPRGASPHLEAGRNPLMAHLTWRQDATLFG